MKVVQADKSYTFGPGSTLLFPKNQLSAVIKQPKDGVPYKALVVGLFVDRLKSYYAKNPPDKSKAADHSVRIYDKQPLLESFFASMTPYFDLEQKLPETVAALKMEEAISILRFIDPGVDGCLSDFAEPGKINLVEFMEKHYMFNMSVEKFAYLTGRSRSTFIRDFLKAFGETPQQWLTQQRLKLAHFRLAEQQKKPSDLYLEIGFENLSHFSYAFKKQFGYPPSEVVARQL
ncbi:AraC-type DNA-binding protein [Dyadobacter sp. SG02]|nr:AraC family transcriptional regulator [Dyadobacter sp. SG02]SEI53144.1 AraC-type DNA-binding protein [Dyadobacter sp. SG02]